MKNKRIRLVPVTKFFHGKISSREAFDRLDGILANVDLFLRERLSAKLHKHHSLTLQRYHAQRCSNDISFIINMISERKDIPLHFKCEDMLDIISAKLRYQYESCGLSESILDPDNYDFEDEAERRYAEDANFVFDGYTFPDIPAGDFDRFSEPQTSIPDEWKRSKSFKLLAETLPKDPNYNCTLYMLIAWHGELSGFSEKLMHLFDLSAAYMKLAGKRAEGERMLRAKNDYSINLREYQREEMPREIAERVLEELNWTLGEVAASIAYDNLADFDTLRKHED